MSSLIEVKVPDIGDFKDIEVIDALLMTTTGNVQRRVLRLQEEERARAAAAARQPVA